MNSLLVKFRLILLMFLFTIHTACAQSNCSFDPSNIKDTRFKTNNISSYTWNKDTKEAKLITNDGNLISVKYWACDHYGVHAVMLVGPYPDDDLNNLGTLFIKLSDIVLDSNERNIIKNYLSKNQLSISEEPKTINIPNTGYSEFNIRHAIVNDSLVFEIKLYKD